MTSMTNHINNIMHTWQLNEAKAKLTEFVKNAKQKPQIITKHGKPEVVAIDIDLYRKLISKNKDFVSFLKASPLYGIDLEIERDKSFFRDTEL
jgi:antitoxin Phd